MSSKRARKPAHMHSSVHAWVQKEFPGMELWTYAEVADYLGKSPLSLRRWVRDGLLDPPSNYGYMGDNLVYLFDADDVERFKQYSNMLRPGRRSKAYTAALIAVGSSNKTPTGENDA